MEERRRLLSEWIAWLERERAELRAERRELGLDPVDDVKEEGAEEEKSGKVVEEIMEEVLDEAEEVM